jgi:hypothetical protein
MAEYGEWKIDAAPIMYHKQYRAAAVIDDDLGQRFVFNDLGDFETREQAHGRAIAWVQRWIDENFGHP